MSLGQARDSATKRIETVEVSGLGQSIREAREDAIRQAIQKVVGVYVDHRRRVELKMTDRQLAEKLDERILSYSNAYVETVEALERREKGKLIEIKMRVSVVVQKLLDQLASSGIPMVGFDSRSAEAMLSSRRDERESAVAVLQSLLQERRKLWRLEIASPKVEPAKPANLNHVWLRLDTTLVVDDEQVRRWWGVFKQFSKYELVGRATLAYERIQDSGGRRHCYNGAHVHGVKNASGGEPIEGRALIGLCEIDIDDPRARGGTARCLGRALAGDEAAQLKPTAEFAATRVKVEFLDGAGEPLREVRLNPAENGRFRLGQPFPAIPAASGSIPDDDAASSQVYAERFRRFAGLLAFCHAGPEVLGVSGKHDHAAEARLCGARRDLCAGGRADRRPNQSRSRARRVRYRLNIRRSDP